MELTHFPNFTQFYKITWGQFISRVEKSNIEFL
jgi:hypothetical protein